MYNASIHCKFELSDNTPNTVERLMFPTSFAENQIQVGIKIAHTNEVIYSYLPAGEWKKGQSYNYPITLTKKEEGPVPVGEAVDLGLSVKWANFNVGASKPEEYGGYYAWGETEEKEDYSESTCLTWGLSKSELQSRGIIGEDGNLTASYDVAATKWGGDWRMPTQAELQELVEKCTWEWTTYNGVNGRRVTGPNENSIFLPAAGRRQGTDFLNAGSYGFYWSARHSGGISTYVIDFGSGDSILGGLWRLYAGLTVRPVTESSSDTPETTTALIVGDVQVENWGTNNEGGTIIVQQ